MRVGELRDLESFAKKLRVLALDGQKRFDGFQYDVEVKISSGERTQRQTRRPKADAVIEVHAA